MSTIRTNTILDAAGGNTATINGAYIRPGALDPDNRIINGAFAFWQRGTSQTTTGYGSADRWQFAQSGGTTTQSRQSFAVGDTLGNSSPSFFLRNSISGQSLASHFAQTSQRLEGVNSYASQTITVLGWARRSSGTGNMAMSLDQSFGTGGTPSASINGTGQTVTLTSSWAAFAVTFSVLSITGKTLGSNGNDFLAVNFWTSAGSDFNSRTNSLGIQIIDVDLWGIHIKVGTHTTAAVDLYNQPELGPELARCQRYFSKSYSIDITPGTAAAVGAAVINTGPQTPLTGRFDLVINKFPQTMRTPPAVTVYNFTTGATGSMRAQNALTNLAATANDIGMGSFSMGINNQTVAATDILRGHYTADAEL